MYFFRNIWICDPYAGVHQRGDLLIQAAKKVVLNPKQIPFGARRIDASHLFALPGLIDLHVHFREPGFEYKETIASGSQAALAGGVTSVLVMPNTRPALDNAKIIVEQYRLAKQANGTRLFVAGAVSKGLLGEDLSDFASYKRVGVSAVTDDGMPVTSDKLMRAALEECRKNDLLFMQHAEDFCLSGHGHINESALAARLKIKAQSPHAESQMIARDIALVKQTRARYHVLHLSTRQSLEIVKKAKKERLAVSCEVTPHHLLLDDAYLFDCSANKKMNPPLRHSYDRLALLQALKEGWIDAVATDHAPHAKHEKLLGLHKAPFGVIGLETAFSLLYSLVLQKHLCLEQAVALMSSNPAQLLKQSGILGTFLAPKAKSDVCIFDPNEQWTVGAEYFKSKSHNSAFLGRKLQGRVLASFVDAQLCYATKEFAACV